MAVSSILSGRRTDDASGGSSSAESRCLSFNLDVQTRIRVAFFTAIFCRIYDRRSMDFGERWLCSWGWKQAQSALKRFGFGPRARENHRGRARSNLIALQGVHVRIVDIFLPNRLVGLIMQGVRNRRTARPD